MRKLAFVGLFVVGSAWAADKPPAKKAKPIVVERVVGVVNDTVILQTEVVQRAATMAGELDQIPDAREKERQWKALVRQMLSDMIDEELILQAGSEAQLDVTEDEVDRAIEEVKKNNKLTDKQLLEALGAQGYTLATYRKDVKRNILRLRSINILVRPRVNVSDDEVKAYYDKTMGKAAMVTEVRVAHILLSLSAKPSAEELDTARRRAAELVARARGGEDFAQLVLGNSDDPATKQNGGDLDWFKRNELPTEWEEVLFSMEVGDVRGPLTGPRGLHVFKILDNKKEKSQAFEKVKQRLHDQLYAQELEKQTKLWIEELRKKAHVEVKL
jgi:parvulin-like peptidyl-prolyl isomerase